MGKEAKGVRAREVGRALARGALLEEVMCCGVKLTWGAGSKVQHGNKGGGNKSKAKGGRVASVEKSGGGGSFGGAGKGNRRKGK